MTDRHSSIVAAAKATLIGGAVFLIPGFLAVFVLGKILGLLKSLALAIGPSLGIESTLGGVLLDVAAIVVMLLICFIGGVIARRATARRLRTKLDQMLLGSFPGYAFVKGLAENIHQSEENASSFLPVVVRFDEYSQMAFETGRMPGGAVAIFLPGAPNPWSGNVVFVSAERVHKLAIAVTEAIQIQRTLGKSAEGIAAAANLLATEQSASA